MKPNNIISAFAFLLIISSTSLKAQGHFLTVGDKLPSIFIPKLVNYKSPSANTQDFKNKLLILDFWATWCSPCVAALPKMDSLQKEFGDQIQILSITNEPAKKVNNFFDNFSKVRLFKPNSVVVEDTTLRRLFNFITIPFYVWVDSKGIIIATSEAQYVTAENIQKALGGQALTFPMRAEPKRRVLDRDKPIFFLGNSFVDDSGTLVEELSPDRVLCQSVATKYIPGIESETIWDSTRFTAKNVTVSFLYGTLYGLTYYNYYTPNFHAGARQSVEIKDSAILNRVSNDMEGAPFESWLSENGICYELVWKGLPDWKSRFAVLKDDIDRYFGETYGVEAHIEKRVMPSDVLVTVNKGKADLKTKGEKPKEEYNMYHYKLQNMPLSQFVTRLQSYFFQRSPKPIADNTGYTKNVDIELNCKMTDIDAINQELAKYGLKFIDKNWAADVLVITDRAKSKMK